MKCNKNEIIKKEKPYKIHPQISSMIRSKGIKLLCAISIYLSKWRAPSFCIYLREPVTSSLPSGSGPGPQLE